jgi:hypothetical protein
MSVDFAMGFPQGEFADNVDGTGWGMNFDILYRLHGSPVLIGGDIGFLIYGKQSRDEPLSPTIPDLVVTVDTTNNILPTHFLVRYDPLPITRRFRPYAEGVFGLNYLWTQTSIRDSDDDISSTNLSDTVLSGGVGGGVLVRLAQAGISDENPAFSIDLKLGARYLWGGNAEYLTEDSIHIDGDSVTYFVRRSSTNLFCADIGIAFSF